MLLVIFNRVKKYNNEIVLILFCIGIFFYAIGLANIGFIKNQTLFHIGGVLFILFNYNFFNKSDLKALAIPIISLILLIMLGLLTYFDTTMQHSFIKILKEINSHIIGYFVLFFISYLFAKYSKDSIIKILFGFFIILCIINIIATIYLGIKNGLFISYNAPFFNNSITKMILWICFSNAISIAGFIFLKGYKKILFFIFVLLCFLAILSNGERAYIIAFIMMAITSLFILNYKYKILVIILSLCCFYMLIYCFYHYSKNLPPRYNFAHMIDNFYIIWNTNPIEMGKYDINCFNNTIDCSKESTKNGKSDIIWEHSSLARIAMYKSALKVINENPITPRIIGMWNTGSYLHKYYEITNKNRVYIDNFIYDKRPILYGYQHIHSLPLSITLEFGLFGLLAYIILCAYIIYCGFNLLKTSNLSYKIISLSMVITTVGIITSTIFDIVFIDTLKVIFIVFGLLVGFCWKKLDLSHKKIY